MVCRLALVTLLLGQLSFAAPTTDSKKIYNLKMQISLDGKRLSSPEILLKDGEAGTIIQNDAVSKSVIQVIAKDHGSKKISVSFNINYQSKDGTRNFVSKPRILTLENESATMSAGDAEGKEDFALSVLVEPFVH